LYTFIYGGKEGGIKKKKRRKGEEGSYPTEATRINFPTIPFSFGGEEEKKEKKEKKKRGEREARLAVNDSSLLIPSPWGKKKEKKG